MEATLEENKDYLVFLPEDRVINTASEWLKELENYAKQETVQNKFCIEDTAFDMLVGFRIAAQLYRAEDPWAIGNGTTFGGHIKDNLPWLVNVDYKEQGKNVKLDIDAVIADMYSDSNTSDLKAITLKECIALENEEQKAIAFRGFTPEEIVVGLNLEIIGEETVMKKHKRWTVTEDGISEEEVEFPDTYTLYKHTISTPSGDSVFGIIKCKDTSTDRMYFLYVDITTKKGSNNETLEFMTDPIAAIASNIKMLVPHESIEIDEVYEYIQRQGDVNLGILKEEYKGHPLKVSKGLTREQYLTMIVSES